MRIPKEWYDEDQKVKQAENDKIDKSISTYLRRAGAMIQIMIPEPGFKLNRQGAAGSGRATERHFTVGGLPCLAYVCRNGTRPRPGQTQTRAWE